MEIKIDRKTGRWNDTDEKVYRYIQIERQKDRDIETQKYILINGQVDKWISR